MDDKKLQRIRQKILTLLSQDYPIRRTKYKKVKMIEDGQEVTRVVEDGFRVVEYKLKDWVTADTIYRGKSARERVRMVLQEIRELAKEGRRISLEMDKEDK